MQFYTIHHPNREWGDYSDILFDGMASRDEQSGLLMLERTGPFVPPISFPGGIVVTNAFRAMLENSGLIGFSFQPVVKKLIVKLDWDKWDLEADEPEFHPESGEPEDYILEGQHSPETAEQMPQLWELVIEETAHVERGRVSEVMLMERVNSDRLFRICENLRNNLSEMWLAPQQKEWHNPSRQATVSLQKVRQAVFVSFELCLSRLQSAFARVDRADDPQWFRRA